MPQDFSKSEDKNRELQRKLLDFLKSTCEMVCIDKWQLLLKSRLLSLYTSKHTEFDSEEHLGTFLGRVWWRNS